MDILTACACAFIIIIIIIKKFFFIVIFWGGSGGTGENPLSRGILELPHHGCQRLQKIAA
jgi:hypothetical protein